MKEVEGSDATASDGDGDNEDEIVKISSKECSPMKDLHLLMATIIPAFMLGTLKNIRHEDERSHRDGI